MQFRVLGPFEVEVQAGSAAAVGPLQRVVLACLLAHANQVVSADRLIEELWGDAVPPTAATALQMHVSRLRRALDPDGDRIVTRRPGYLIRVGADEVDALRFEALATRGRTARAGGDVAAAADDLRAALALWRGPALTEFADHGFAQAWAARLDLLRLAALEDRVEADLALGRHDEVVDELAALVEAEPLRERLWGQLMVALYRCGRQAEALRACGRLRETLADELGIDPGPDVRVLEDRILGHDPGLAWAPPASASAGPPSGPAAVISGTTVRDRILVGRTEELAFLLDRFERAAAGEGGGLVLVRGEPGVGKTRLVEELAGSARAAGARVLWGQSYEDRGSGPFGPWASALRQWAASVPPAALAADLGPDCERLAQLAPELAAAERPATPTADPEVARAQLFEAATALLDRLSRQAPTVIVLDDLQWADGASLLLLQHLARSVPAMRALVVVTYRDGEVGRDHPLTATLGDLARQAATERLALSGLAPGEVARMIELATGVPPGPLAALVHQRTEGNPFFVQEVVRLLQAEDRPFTSASAASAAAESLGIPDGVREVVDRRCARLSTAAHRLLGLAAVIGRELDAPLVESVWDGAEDALDLLDELAAAGLLLADRVAVGRYRFSHDIVRETLYGEVSPLRRARFHAVVGRALAADRREPAAVAHHLLLGIPGGVGRAVAAAHAEAAARAATASLAYEEAVAWYERALAALGEDEGGVDEQRVGLMIGLGEARWRVGDVPAARLTLLDAAERARALETPYLLARAVLAFGGGALRSWHATRGRFGERPLVLLIEALERMGGGDTSLRAQLLGLLAEELYYLTAEASRRDQLSAEAVAMARRLGDTATLASALSSRCLAVWNPDHLEERLALATEIVGIGDGRDDRQLRFFGWQYVFAARFELGDIGGADAALDVVDALAEDLRQPLARWEARRFRAMRALFEGDLARAEQLATEALEIGQSAQEPDALAVFGTQFALIRFEQRKLDEVEPALEAFAAEFAESPAWRAALAIVKADLGRTAEARADFDGLAAAGFDTIRRDFAWLAAMAMVAQLCGFVGDDTAREAAEVTALLLPFAGRNVMTGDRLSWGSSCRYLGIAACCEGRLDDAAAWLARAVEENGRWGSRPWQAYSQCELAEVVLAQGDAARAVWLAGAAAATARSLEMPRLLAAATLAGARAAGEAPPSSRLATLEAWSAAGAPAYG